LYWTLTSLSAISIVIHPVLVLFGSTPQRSPSSFNLQPTQIIVVQNEAVKARLADRCMLGAGNQYRTRDCAALAVFLSDLEASERIGRIAALERQNERSAGRHPTGLAVMPVSSAFLLGEGHLATFLKQRTMDAVSAAIRPVPVIEPIQAWSYKNTALLIQSFVLAATSHDLQTTIMEGFDARRVKEVLRIPDRYDIPMIVATGYEYETDTSATPRLDLDEVVFADTFGVPMDLGDENDGAQEDGCA
jgi:nitroreductase